jgi:hypothetical protein
MKEFQLIDANACFGVESAGMEQILNGDYLYTEHNEFESGVCALLLFMQQSFTGPALNLEDKKIDLKLLSVDGEDIYHLTPFAHLLLRAKSIFIDRQEEFQHYKVFQFH